MPNFLGGLSPYSIGAPRVGYGYGGGGPGYLSNPRMQAALMRSNRMAGMVFPDVSGVPSRDGAMLPAGFPPFIFALANGTNIITQQMNPQTPFRGQRLSTNVIRNGTSALATAPLLVSFLVGQKPILTTSTSVALETFSGQTFDTNLLMPPTVPGVTYNMQVNLAQALTTTDTLQAFVAIIGSALL